MVVDSRANPIRVSKIYSTVRLKKVHCMLRLKNRTLCIVENNFSVCYAISIVLFFHIVQLVLQFGLLTIQIWPWQSSPLADALQEFETCSYCESTSREAQLWFPTRAQVLANLLPCPLLGYTSERNERFVLDRQIIYDFMSFLLILFQEIQLKCKCWENRQQKGYR